MSSSRCKMRMTFPKCTQWIWAKLSKIIKNILEALMRNTFRKCTTLLQTVTSVACSVCGDRTVWKECRYVIVPYLPNYWYIYRVLAWWWLYYKEWVRRKFFSQNNIKFAVIAELLKTKCLWVWQFQLMQEIKKYSHCISFRSININI